MGEPAPRTPASPRATVGLPGTGVAKSAADPWAGNRWRLDRQRWRTYARGAALALLYALPRVLVDVLVVRGRSSADRDLELLVLRQELLVLRQELLVLRRTARRPRWQRAHRMILAALGRRLPASALLLVQPGHHPGLAPGTGPSTLCRIRPPPRSWRPQRPAECEELVLRLANENPLWVYMRIHGELLKLGHRVSATSIRNLLRRHRIPPAPRRGGLTWRRFLRAHGRAIPGL